MNWSFKEKIVEPAETSKRRKCQEYNFDSLSNQWPLTQTLLIVPGKVGREKSAFGFSAWKCQEYNFDSPSNRWPLTQKLLIVPGKVGREKSAFGFSACLIKLASRSLNITCINVASGLTWMSIPISNHSSKVIGFSLKHPMICICLWQQFYVLLGLNWVKT